MLDLRTLIFALIVTFTIQAVLFMVITMAIKVYRDVRLWAFGCIMLALNFIALYLRNAGSWEDLSIITVNLCSLSAFLFFYYGTKNLLNLPYKASWPLVVSVFYMAFIAYFTFISDHLNVRIILFSAMMAFIMIKIGTTLIIHHKKSFKSSALILATLFILLGVFYLFRATYTLIFPPENNNFFLANRMQSFTFLVSLCIGIIWSQGVIFLVNQKLRGELTKKTEELESSNVDKDKFFSVLAHDLRGPLATIESMIDLMTDIKYDIDAKQHQAMTLAMKKTAHSTNILLDNLLDWASMQSGLKTTQRVQTTYERLMIPVLPVLQAQAIYKNITIKDKIPPETPLTVDSKMTQSIFRNLVANAIKFTPTNGCILLHVNTAEDGKTLFSISDNGIGMNKQLMENVFEKGSIGRRLGTNGETSTGLGLMICKEFVEKHGGQIWVESEVGKGSTFSFCLEPTS